MERSYAMHITHKLILITVTILATGTAAASGPGIFTGQSIGPVAELSPDERARFRERWQEMPPEQRDAVRNRLRQGWRDLPPEQRQARRQNLIERGPDRGNAPPAGRDRRDRGYGQGYGTRP